MVSMYISVVGRILSEQRRTVSDDFNSEYSVSNVLSDDFNSEYRTELPFFLL